jgi:hypothetical protein
VGRQRTSARTPASPPAGSATSLSPCVATLTIIIPPLSWAIRLPAPAYCDRTSCRSPPVTGLTLTARCGRRSPAASRPPRPGHMNPLAHSHAHAKRHLKSGCSRTQSPVSSRKRRPSAVSHVVKIDHGGAASGTGQRNRQVRVRRYALSRCYDSSTGFVRLQRRRHAFI